MRRIPVIIITILLVAGSCNNKQKNEEVKEDIKQRMDRVEENVDEGMDKVRDRLQEIRDSLKNKIHRATEPDSLP
jgi:chaperonin cofactor prefoldin